MLRSIYNIKKENNTFYAKYSVDNTFVEGALYKFVYISLFYLLDEQGHKIVPYFDYLATFKR